MSSKMSGYYYEKYPDTIMLRMLANMTVLC